MITIVERRAAHVCLACQEDARKFYRDLRCFMCIHNGIKEKLRGKK